MKEHTTDIYIERSRSKEREREKMRAEVKESYECVHMWVCMYDKNGNNGGASLLAS